ncbi:hypothetical protein GMES_0367 [Paraglaciecola mesophila KMM 241]|uniref:Uncharacterized protein n=1 Tax=Paraglaciecola mesophila KMM 241 TaxID=1128912 RepID=K6YFA1_9ALTE|nr:hypothetical protein GMES_0367 [Paraglaciecola mesophila KMM 241]
MYIFKSPIFSKVIELLEELSTEICMKTSNSNYKQYIIRNIC